MMSAVAMAEIRRGGVLESLHRGHAVICGPGGAVEAVWGDPSLVIYPRSAVKMIQALPLLTSGAADAAGLEAPHLALACASHSGEAGHAERVRDWLAAIDRAESDLRCGAHLPLGEPAKEAMLRAGGQPCQLHNNCSGKHAGFLTLSRHLGGDPDYVAPDHPVQKTVRAAFEEATGAESPGFGIDGCSAPNFRARLDGIAGAMAWFASAAQRSDSASRAAARLVQAMMAHPDMVAGEGRACTELMQAAKGRAAIKTGAEGVFCAILPETGHGIALKIEDGATRASECAMAALLVHMGILPADHPAIRKRLNPPILNARGINCGEIRVAGGWPG